MALGIANRLTEEERDEEVDEGREEEGEDSGGKASDVVDATSGALWLIVG